MTEQETKWMERHTDMSVLLDPDLKPEILKEHLRDVTQKIEQKLKRTTRGGKVMVFICETR